MRSPIRVVCYAVNGSGIGHLVRLIGIARWMRRYAAWLRTPFEISFLASSEADTLLFREKIPCFKLPSKTAAQEGKLDKATYLAMAKQWVWHSMALLRPDLFVADTFPSGSFGELVTSLDLCKRKALILREMRGDFARKPEVQAMLPLYDSIIVPSSESECEVPISASLKGRTHYVGPIAVRERVEMFSRSAALAELGLSGDKPVVYVSAGGGGDAGAEGQLLRVIEALEALEVDIVVGAGPLYRGRFVRRKGTTWLGPETAAEIAPAFSVAVCAAGYNTFAELMLAGIPAVFVPQSKIADDQHARALRAERVGAAVIVASPDAATDIAQAVGALLARRDEASRAAQKLVPENGARVAAAQLLRLVLPQADVDDAEDMVGDVVLAASIELSVEDGWVLDLMRELGGERGSDLRETTEHGDLAARSAELARHLFGRGLSPEATLRFVRAVARRLPPISLLERLRAVRAIADALGEFDDWSGAASLVQSLEPSTDADGLLRGIERVAFAIKSDRLSLIEGLRRLAILGAGP